MLEPLWPQETANYHAAKLFPKLTRDVSRGLDYTHILDTHEAYREYLKGKWATDKRPVLWTKRGAPFWYVNS